MVFDGFVGWLFFLGEGGGGFGEVFLGVVADLLGLLEAFGRFGFFKGDIYQVFADWQCIIVP